MSKSKFHFIDIEQQKKEMLTACCQYVGEHEQELMNKFVCCFDEYCKKIVHMQKLGEKNAIGFINFSVLRSNILAKRHYIRLDAYDKSWYQDLRECSHEYYASEFFEWLDKLADSLEEVRRQSVGKITSADVQQVIFEAANQYMLFVAELIRLGMEKVIETESFQAVNREKVFMVCIGGYHDKVDILYKEDSTVKDAEQVKRYLESGVQSAYTHEFCEKLDLSEGCYEGLQFIFSSFAACDFTKSSWKKSRLLYSDFKKTICEDVDFREAQLLDTDFSGAVLKNVDFTGAKLRHISFRDAKLSHVRFSDALMAMELDFTGAELDDVALPEA